MAIFMRKSAKVINHLKSKMGVVGVINLLSPSTLFHHQDFSVAAPIARTLGNPDADLSIKATLFSSRRFKSTKADKHLNSLNDADDNKVYIGKPTINRVFYENKFGTFLLYFSSGVFSYM
jgi:hypothetical protein